MTGTDIRTIRQKLGFSQEEFARLLGYRRIQTISEFELDKKPLPRPALILLTLIRLLLQIAENRNDLA